MSTAKEEFLKKLNDKKTSEDAHKKATSENILKFQKAIDSLAESIKTWLTDTPLVVDLSQKRITDTTADNSVYDATCIKISNGDKKASFEPEYLYYIGSMGGLDLTISNPSRSPSQNRYKLFMKSTSEHGWIVVAKNAHNDRDEQELNEDLFFKLIDALI